MGAGDRAMLGESLLQAQGIVANLRALLTDTTRNLATACVVDGRLDAALLDRRQVPCYDLAWATAELLAAETALAAMSAGESDPLNQRLVLICVAEAVVALRDRLDVLALELPQTRHAVEQLFGDPQLRAFRQRILASDFLDDTAQSMSRDPSRLAWVELDGDRAIVHRTFARFANEVIAPLAESIHRNDLTVPEDILAPLKDMGVFGLSIPARYGGSAPEEGDDTISMVVVTEALAEASLAAAGSLITRPEILSRALMTGGTEAQRALWLPRLAAGHPLCGIAITEPDYGSDVDSLSLRASRCDKGWLLNGAKTWCTFAGKAGVLMVVARTDPDRSRGHCGLSLLLVEKPVFEGHDFVYEQEGGGRLSGRAIATIGYRGMHSFDLSFDNLFVPDSHVIGEQQGLGRGFYYTMAGMVGGRMQTAARASGVMRAALLAGLRYARERRVFGKPLLDFPLTAAKLAKIAARYAASRYLVYSLAPLLDRDSGALEASLAKLFACRAAELVTRESQQLHGGMGYAEEMPISRYFVDARVLSIFEGAEETLALKVIARALLESELASRGA
ncbi:MAG: acyl-CoA dehydrogenase family protein [Parahaliea sp.]